MERMYETVARGGGENAAAAVAAARRLALLLLLLPTEACGSAGSTLAGPHAGSAFALWALLNVGPACDWSTPMVIARNANRPPPMPWQSLARVSLGPETERVFPAVSAGVATDEDVVVPAPPTPIVIVVVAIDVAVVVATPPPPPPPTAAVVVDVAAACVVLFAQASSD